MPAILTPALALRYLRELSTDVRAAVVLDPAGELLAGDAAALASARELLGVLDGAAAHELIVRVVDGGELRGTVLAARAVSPVAPVVVLAAGPHALLELLRHDVATAVRGLVGAGGEAAAETASPPPAPLADVVAIGAEGSAEALESADSAVRTAIFAGRGVLSALAPSEDLR